MHCVFVFSKSNLFYSSVKLNFFSCPGICSSSTFRIFCIFCYPPVDLISQVTCSEKKCIICGIMACLVYNSVSGYDAFCEYAFNYVLVLLLNKLVVLIMLIKFGSILIVIYL